MPMGKIQTDPKFSYKSLLAKWNKRPAESDHHAPETNAVNFVGLRRHLGEAELYVLRANENNNFLKNNFALLHTRGIVNPFRESELILRPKMLARREKALALLQENKIMLYKIQSIKGDIEKTSHRPLEPVCQRQLDFRRFVPPTEILSKYRHVKLPKGEHLWRLLRPRIWLEVETMRVPYSQQGRLTIELYTEAAPMVVREFIKCCVCQDNRIQMLRLFPNLWLEGEIKLSDNRLINHSVEYDIRALQHDAGRGILSFPIEFINGFQFGVLSFTISSRPLRVLNGKRVAFGRVIHGMKIIDVLQEYGTKNGKLKKPLCVTACGVETFN